MPMLLSRAKLNLFLEVVGKRSDGFHDIESIFVEIDLADILTADAEESGVIVFTCDVPEVPTDNANLVIRAADLLQRECGARGGIRFRLEKRIPMGSGLGGGSSNAAAALRLANELWKTGLSRAELAALGARLGSDVPFFLHGGVCLCEGRGERVTPVPFPVNFPPLGLALSGIHCDTAAAYRGLRLPTPDGRLGVESFLRAMEAGNIRAMAASAFNRFEETVFAALPELGGLHSRLEQRLKRPVRMSGSGSGLWFFNEPAVEENSWRKDTSPEEAIERKVRLLPVHVL